MLLTVSSGTIAYLTDMEDDDFPIQGKKKRKRIIC